MQPTDISNRTRAIGAPRNWDPAQHGDCGVLCVRDATDEQSGFPTMTSAWLPDANELALLNLGLPIMLTIYGSVHPVVSVGIGQRTDLVSPEGAAQ